jgi:DNA polymerase V
MRIEAIYELKEELSQHEIPVFGWPVKAGFPSPAEDFIEQNLDLNTYLIRNKPATFMLKVSGDSMMGAGILDGDLIVVDRSLDPEHGRIAVVRIGGEFTVKRLHYKDNHLFLMPENPQYSPIQVNVDELNSDYQVWGIVIGAIHTYPYTRTSRL